MNFPQGNVRSRSGSPPCSDSGHLLGYTDKERGARLSYVVILSIILRPQGRGKHTACTYHYQSSGDTQHVHTCSNHPHWTGRLR